MSAENPALKLTYFDLRGRAETVRLAFMLGGIEFEDERISFEDFPALKESGDLPFGSLPVLFINGKPHTQSGGIIRFAGKLSSLYPSDPFAAIRVDEILHLSEDIGKLMPSRDIDEEAAKRFVEEGVPRYFGGAEKLFEQGDGPFLLGNEMTVADIFMYVFWKILQSGYFTRIPKDIFDPYKNLMKAVNAVAKNEKVMEWEKRPENINRVF